jgi:hypothetical protein
MVAPRCWFMYWALKSPSKVLSAAGMPRFNDSTCVSIFTETGNDLLTCHSPNVPAGKLDA